MRVVRFHWPEPTNFNGGCSSTARVLRCERGGTGSIPVGHPNSYTWGLAKRPRQRSLKPPIPGSNPGSPAKRLRQCPSLSGARFPGGNTCLTNRTSLVRFQARQPTMWVLGRVARQRTFNPHEAGSIPAGPTSFYTAVTQSEECRASNAEAAGSSPAGGASAQFATSNLAESARTNSS
jgi:hypothetical protein